jgi:DnaJ-class molecular chaperone
LRYHPDVYAGADAGGRFREVADAYDVLRDPARRARYDAMSRPIARRPRDGPRFIDEDDEVGGERWPRTRSTRREVWQWR